MGETQSQVPKQFVNSFFRGGLLDYRFALGKVKVMLHELAKWLRFVRWLFILASQRKDWSPIKILGELWRLVTNIGKLHQVLELLKVPPFDEILRDNPRLAFKYLVPNYLARGFTLTERVSCFLHHFRRMHAVLPDDILRQILQADVTLHEISNGVNSLTLTMGLPESYVDREGELSLNLRMDGEKIFDLSFTIVPGWVVNSEVAETLLITRLQGTPRCSQQIKLACKVVYGYPPRGVLLAALQGIACAFGINEIEAVCAMKQMSYTKGRAVVFKNGYDDFFASVGMMKTDIGFYSSPVPIRGKPLASFKGGARPRAKKRRVIMQQIQLACADFFLGVADRSGLSSPCAENSSPARQAVESCTALD